MTLYLAPAALGLGDLVVTLPVVQSLIKQGEKLVLILRLSEHEAVAKRIAGLAGYVMEWEFNEKKIDSKDRYIDLRDHDLQRHAWWGSQKFEQDYPNWQINDILEVICKDKGLAVDFAYRQPLAFEPRPNAAGKIIFIPGSAVSFKCWPFAYWIDLARRLAEKGISAAVVGQPDYSGVVSELINFGVEWLPMPLLSDAIDVISSAKMVVSVDTGLLHISVHQGVETIGLYRQLPVYVRDFPNSKELISPIPCAQACRDIEMDKAHHTKPKAGKDFVPADWACVAPIGKQCMDAISASQVFDTILPLLLGADVD